MACDLALYCAGSVVGTVVIVLGIQRVFKNLMKPKPPTLTKDYPKDTVLLHQFGMGKYVPSLSPFPVKLETYLRMAKIPYRNVHDRQFSSKGKIPWMEYNGVAVPDSQFCIEYLNEQRNVDLDKHLSPEQKAVARAFLKMVEENLYWSIVYWRYVVGRGADLTPLSNGAVTEAFVKPFLPVILDEVWAAGMGRHEKQEMVHITRGDFAALAHYLGSKPFLMGDAPSEVDCAVFGMLSQAYWHMPNSPHTDMMNKEFPNLRDYCYRMKERFWPDWDQCILSPGDGSGDKKDQ